MGNPISLKRRFEPLTEAGFEGFGSVVEIAKAGGYPINDGTTMRFDYDASLILDRHGGKPLLSCFVAEPARLPLVCARLERHPMSSQLFMPLGERPFAVVVARGEDAPDPSTLRAFVTNGRQGVNYAPGIWHHPLIALETAAEFFVLGRKARPGEDFDLTTFPGGISVEIRL